MHDQQNGKIGVTIIEDSEIHAEWMKEQFCDQAEFLVLSIDHFGRSGIDSVRKNQPNVVLLDFQLPDITGLEAARRIKSYSKDIKIFALTSHTETAIIERIIADKNVDAIAIKGSDYFENTFLASVRCVADGGSFIDPSLLKTIRNSGKLKGLAQLTKREFEVFIQASVGKDDDEIARDLYVDVPHVKNLRSRISKKIKNDSLDSLLSKLIQNAEA